MLRLLAFVAVVSALFFLGKNLFAETETFDVLIKNGTVFDGTGAEPKRLDIGIAGERIAAVGKLGKARAERVIDASKLAVAPGFIDIHTHSDFNPFLNPKSPHKILQGVTTEVAGNCGMSAAPVEGRYKSEVRHVWEREGVAIKDPSWSDVAGYVKAAESQGLTNNLILLAGHGNIRGAVMGFEARAAKTDEIKDMQRLLDKSFEQGAYGLSLGLTYIPGGYAEKEELVALARAAASRGRIVAVHMKSEGATLIESLEQTIQIARESGATVQISHLKAAGLKNWGKINEAFAKIGAAKKQGVKIFADVYPYEASAAELGVILPNAIFQAPDRVEMLTDPAKRAESKKVVSAEFERNGMTLKRVMIAQVNLPEHKKYQGKIVQDAAELEGKDPVDFLFDLLLKEDFKVSAFSFGQSPDVVRRVIAQPYAAIGSDSVADFSTKPHPRCYGTFPRVFDTFVKKRKALDRGRAVYKMTGLPAEILGLKDRGKIQKGAYADLVVFDPEKFKANSTYENSTRLASGMVHVFLNGRQAVEGGKPKDVQAGRVLTAENPRA